ncbi:hypothetical protein C2E23DRAFT_738159 [Lenzites betulinus]|nr:hypothetical protein C2E23DRAFT_738159 [Lenzites betulinus]
MFKFNFDVDESDELVAEVFDSAHAGSTTFASKDTKPSAEEVTSKYISLEQLLSTLPHTFSFSPLAIPLVSKGNLVLSRRDLFDARFQLIAQDEDSAAKHGHTDLDFLDAPSDLVPGIYEGGLKTWECSLDLVEALASIHGEDLARNLRKKRTVEFGCGTAVPSLYLLHCVFSGEPSTDNDIHIHMQDYNELVLRLVTLPNVVLAWYMSPASQAFRSSTSTEPEDKTDEDAEFEPLPPADPSEPGELQITPALTAAFLESLRQYGVHLKFFSGSWGTFDIGAAGGPYHVVLTSETIYRPESLGSLVDLLRRASAISGDNTATALVERTSQLSLKEGSDLRRLAHEPYLCVVAAKLVYFGVGGGVAEFVQAVESGQGGGKGTVHTIWEKAQGVKRSIMQVTWNTA